ncbi:hypothetical protein TRFO_31803 [Tritrichomonas foetus]|uniref:DUF4833 domain-containing protein n=1 Tax=Tritrichomonas foetus TaxID=1144522 RepID=A0A1J4JRP4_9EUKA|nr:hypothetical protein TRFO_31803 [Tritrichomonas foetus]|eukprot:OHT01418.1 hypothetical protein TRFO_31803 [Tritrichomonas foetus]
MKRDFVKFKILSCKYHLIKISSIPIIMFNQMRKIFCVGSNITKNHVRYSAIESKASKNGLVVDAAWYDNFYDRAAELHPLERKLAYGCDISRDKNGTNTCRLAACKNKCFTIEKNDDGSFMAVTKIGDKDCILNFIWVQCTRTVFNWPKIEFIELFGVDLETKKEVTERIQL